MLPVVDDVLDESDALADVLAFAVDFALADDDGLFVGLDEDLVAAVDTWPRVGAELVQLGLGVGWTLFLADPLELGLAPVLALEDVVGVVGTEPPGLALGVTLSLGLALALPDALELALAVLPLLVLPLEDVAGAVVVAVVLLGELLVVDVTDECVDGDAQALREGCRTTAGLLDGTLPAAEDVGEVVPWPSWVPGPLGGGAADVEGRADGVADTDKPLARGRHDRQDHADREHGRAEGEGRPEHGLAPVPGPPRLASPRC